MRIDDNPVFALDRRNKDVMASGTVSTMRSHRDCFQQHVICYWMECRGFSEMKNACILTCLRVLVVASWEALICHVAAGYIARRP